MSNHSDLKYLFGQPKLNVRKARWLATLSEFDFEINYINGKESKVVDSLSMRIQVNRLEIVSSYVPNLDEKIKSVGKQDESYQQVKERLWKGGEDGEYHLTKDDLVRFKGFPKIAKQDDAIMVVIDNHRKVTHFTVVKSTNSTSEIAKIFIREILNMHGIPKKIVFNKDAKFTSRFWKELFIGLGTKLAFSTTYHPLTNGKGEKTNWILEDMLRMYVMHHPNKWEGYLPLGI
eukprot:PITA_11729